MKLMYTLRENYLTLTLNMIVTEDTNYIRWNYEPLREAVFHVRPTDLLRVAKGTVMPQHWMR